MAREIKKPAKIKERDLKEYAGDIVIDVTPGKKESQPVVAASAKVEQIQVDEAQAAAQPGARLISFAAWFQKTIAKNPRLKMSYHEAVKAHCKAVGLGDQATEEAFDAALAHFGL
jgi:hypothetical protein